MLIVERGGTRGRTRAAGTADVDKDKPCPAVDATRSLIIMAVALTFVGSTLATLAEHAGQHVLPLPPYPPAPLPPAPAHRSCGC